MRLFLPRFKPKHPTFSRQLSLVASDLKLDVVLDVGANEGQFARELFWAGYQGSVVSFEPQPFVHAQLERAASGNSRWRVAPPLALGAAEGTQTLAVFNRSDMSSFLPATDLAQRAIPELAETARLEVRVATLDSLFDDYVKPHGRALLKMDTQGYEREILDGAKTVLPRIAAILLELSASTLYAGQPRYLDLLNLLEAHGFRLWHLSPGYFCKRTHRLLDFDALLVNSALAPPFS
jgi:FkbM family methyltransferase